MKISLPRLNNVNFKKALRIATVILSINILAFGIMIGAGLYGYHLSMKAFGAGIPEPVIAPILFSIYQFMMFPLSILTLVLPEGSKIGPWYWLVFSFTWTTLVISVYSFLQFLVRKYKSAKCLHNNNGTDKK